MTNPRQIPSNERTVVNLDVTLRTTGGFTQVPNVVLAHPGLSLAEKGVYGVLLRYSWQKEFCYPAQESLARDCAISVRQVQRYLCALKAHGAIDWKQTGLNQPNRYFLQPLQSWIAELPECDADTTDLSPPDTTHVSSQDTTAVSYKEDSAKNTQSNVNVRTSKTQSGSPDAHAYNPEELEARIFSLREGLKDQSKSDFNIRQIVKKLPANLVDEAYYQALGKASDGATSSPAKYFIGICKNKAGEQRIDLGFTGRGVRNASPKPRDPAVVKNTGPRSIGDLTRRRRA